MNNQVVLIIIINLLFLLIIFLLYKLINFLLKRKSLVYKEIIKLNSYYFFFDTIPKKIIIKDFVNSKRSVLKYDFTSRICYFIDNNKDNLLLTIGDVYHNRKYLKLYNKEYLNIINSIKGSIIKKYILKKLCLKVKLKPRINFILKVYVTNNKYTIYNTYNYEELLILVKRLKDVKLRKKMKRKFMQIERNKLGDGLRYDILKRDNFRCKICGSGASDGVKLHVDHIMPIAYGGKTEISNLQTLCERCNLGKSDKV